MQQSDPYEKQRYTMVERQIMGRGIKDSRVLDALRTVPRHAFVPESMQDYAYEDSPLPIGHDQTISQPYIVAYMTEKLNLKGDESVLEIGTGSGYQAAVLAEMAKKVYTIEIVEALATQAQNRLKKAGYKNIEYRIGDGYVGWSEAAPFDAIIITAAPEQIPESLIAQLKIGGRMIVPVGRWAQELLLITRTETDHKIENLIPVRFVPMIGGENSD